MRTVPILLVLTLTVFPPAGLSASERVISAESDVLLIDDESSVGHEILIEVRIPDLSFVEENTLDGKYIRPALAGYGYLKNPGTPAIPAKCIYISVPEGAVIEIEEACGVFKKVNVGRILPVPSYTVAWDGKDPRIEAEYKEDEAVYSSSRLYPESIAEVVGYGYLRDARVAIIRVTPVRYDPLNGVLIVGGRVRLSAGLRGGGFPGGKTARRRRTAGQGRSF